MMGGGRQLNEQKLRTQLRHAEALMRFLEQAGRIDRWEYDPPLHEVHDGPVTLTIQLPSRDAFLAGLPHDF